MKKFLKSLVAVMLVCLMAVSFTSCGIPKDPAKVKANLEGEGYKVLLEQVDLGDIGDLLGDKTEANLTASKGDEYITVTWYKDEADAKAAIEDFKKELEEAKAELKDMEDGEAKDKLQKRIDNITSGRSGKMVWVGTKAAVKAAK